MPHHHEAFALPSFLGHYLRVVMGFWRDPGNCKVLLLKKRRMGMTGKIIDLYSFM